MVEQVTRAESSAPPAAAEFDAPPVAAVEPVVRDLHGVRRVDDYAWMRDVEAARTRDHLAAERGYHDRATRHLEPLRTVLFDEMSRRTLPADLSVSWERAGHIYSTRTLEGRDYEQILRHDPVTDDWRVLLDGNELASGHDYMEIGLREVSPDGSLLAYSVDHDGDEVYALRFRDLGSSQDLADLVERTYYTGAWSADSRSFFYTVHDEAYRPFQVWRHDLGSPSSDDALVLQEDDEQYNLEVEASRDGRLAWITAYNRTTTEVWLLDAERPDQPAMLVEGRREGVEYLVEPAPTDGGDELLILTNDGAPEFRLMRAPAATPGRDQWVELVAEDPDERLDAVAVFAHHVVVSLRRDAATFLRILSRDGSRPPVEVGAPGPATSIAMWRNETYDADHVLVETSSWSGPTTWWSMDLGSGELTQVKQLEVPTYDEGHYVSERLEAPTTDGETVPVTVVRRSDVPLDGTAPCLLYAYGSYEASEWPTWDPSIPSLLDRGVVYAVAHVRGGGERGRRWWDAGHLQHKQNTFTDLVSVADFLADGRVDPGRIVSRGLSAGGLLQAAVFTQRPDRWRGVVAEVPFVDVVTTMLDASIPLTANEWDEWGDPRRAEDFAWMLAYSPYDNIPAPGGRPDLLVTGAVNDPRVMVWEPAKWVAALRATDPEWSPRCVFRVELGAGAHVGPSGRYAHLRYEADVYAWVLERFGLAQV